MSESSRIDPKHDFAPIFAQEPRLGIGPSSLKGQTRPWQRDVSTCCHATNLRFNPTHDYAGVHTYTLTGYKRTDAAPSYPHPASGFPLSGMSAAGPPPSGGEEGLPSHDDSSGRLCGVHSLAWRLRVEARWRRTRYLHLAHNSFSKKSHSPSAAFLIL